MEESPRAMQVHIAKAHKLMREKSPLESDSAPATVDSLIFDDERGLVSILISIFRLSLKIGLHLCVHFTNQFQACVGYKRRGLSGLKLPTDCDQTGGDWNGFSGCKDWRHRRSEAPPSLWNRRLPNILTDTRTLAASQLPLDPGKSDWRSRSNNAICSSASLRSSSLSVSTSSTKAVEIDCSSSVSSVGLSASSRWAGVRLR